MTESSTTTQSPSLPQAEIYGVPREAERGELQQWYRQTLADTEKASVLIHVIEHDLAPRDVSRLYVRQQTYDMEKLYEYLEEDLNELNKNTDGVVLIWCGQQTKRRTPSMREDDRRASNTMHWALRRFLTQPNKNFPGHFMAIAIPSRADTLQKVKDALKKKPQAKTAAASAEGDTKETPTQAQEAPATETLADGDQQKNHSTEGTPTDTPEEDEQPTPSTGAERGNLLRNVMDTFEENVRGEKGNPQRPVVCLLVNGGSDALRTVKFALDREIPVLVVQGTGGYADLVSYLYYQAQPKTKVERDDDGQIVNRYVRVLSAGVMENIQTRMRRSLPDDCELLKAVVSKLNNLTIYSPSWLKAVSSGQETRRDRGYTLTVRVIDALLKHKQEEKITYLIDTMKRREGPTTNPSGFLGNIDIKLGRFLDALVKNKPAVVATFLEKLEIPTSAFHAGFFIPLYYKSLLKKIRRDQNKRSMADYREKLLEYLENLPTIPLHCPGIACHACTQELIKSDTEWLPESCVKDKHRNDGKHQTCLHPMHELFLWSLLTNRVDMALIFWDRCDDRMAAALFATEVFSNMAKKEKNSETAKRLKENARRFEDLAIATFTSCYDLDEEQTELLLIKQCPWWGGISLLQVAILTKSKRFLVHPACKQHLGRIWKGECTVAQKRERERREKDEENCKTDGKDGAQKTSPKTETESGKADGRAEGRRRDVSSSGFVDREQKFNTLCSPHVCYRINCATQLLFLSLFSYVLLFDHIESGPPSACFIVLIIWVFDVMCEEIRQVFTENRADRGGATASATVVPVKHWLMKQVRVYFKDEWNKLDICCLGFFALGMVVFCNNQELQRTGRVLLSVDFICFSLRFLQMYMVFDRLGLLVAMLPKLSTDAYHFVFILLVFVMSYAVASESLLFSHSLQFTVHHVMVFYKAVFQLFGELSLEQINGDDCQNSTQMDQYPSCPAKYGSNIVTVMLAVYMLFTNILLLNLLIARFSATFTEVMEQAEEYRSWHNWQLLREFYNRSHIEVWPALNIITFIPPHSFISLCLLGARWLYSRCRKSRDRAHHSAMIIDTSGKYGYQRCVKIKWHHGHPVPSASNTTTTARPTWTNISRCCCPARFTSEATPSISEPTSGIFGATSSNTQPTPSTSGATSSNTQPTPSTSGATSGNTQPTPSTSGTTSSNTQPTPSTSGGTSSITKASSSTSGATPSNTTTIVHIKIFDECMRHLEEVKFKVARQTIESTGWQELTYWRSDPRHFISAKIHGVYELEDDEMDEDTAAAFLAFQLKCVAMRDAQDFESQQARWVRQKEEKDVNLSHVLEVTKSHKDVTQKMQASIQDIAWRQHEQTTKMEGKMDKRLEEMSQQLTKLLKTLQPTARPPETRSE